MTALLERDRELAELDEMVDAARGGRGCFAVIEAVAGLGKTRLVQAARERGHRAGMRTLTARATELERGFPFALVRQLFEPQLATLDEAAREALFEGAAGTARVALGLDGEAPATAWGGGVSDTFPILHGLYWLTAALAEQQPLLLAIDDAHWADAASLDYVGFLLPRLEELPLLLGIACRPDETDADSRLARIATDGLARRLTPRPLSRSAAATLLSTQLAANPDGSFAATCHAISGGNPFLLQELARTVAAEQISPIAEHAPRVHELVPERVARTVIVRLARLSPAAQAVARALVVLGDDADQGLVTELAGLDASTARAGADELHRAAIVDSGAALRFVHPLVRTTLHHELSAGERAAAHARAAELLAAGGAGAQQLAPHLVATEAHGERATAETLLEAGRAALATGASGPAIAYLTRALREPAPPDLRPAILDGILTAGMRTMDPTVFAGIEEDVCAELERDRRLVAAWADHVAPWLAIARRAAETETLLDEAIAIAERDQDVDRALHLEGQRIAYLQLDPATARPRIERYRGRVDPGGAGDRLLAAFGAAWSLFDGTAEEAAPLARRALDGGSIFIERSELLVPGEALRAAILAGELDLAQHAIDQALVLAREHGGQWEQVGTWYLHAHVMLARGDLAAAQADVEQVHAMATASRSLADAPMIVAILVTILRERGALAEAQRELATQGASDGPIEDLPAFDPLLFARAELHLACGRVRAAADDFLLLGERRRRHGTATSPIMQADACAARALAVLGDREHAQALAESALADARRWGGPAPLARALRAAATTLPNAARLAPLHEAVDVLDGSGALLDRVYALAELGAALRRDNRRADARAPLREALQLARRCGAGGLAKQAFEELQATGEKVRRWTPIGVESLTPSERRVAELAASGMTNRQIAQTLFLTVKTIETHLGATYDKLGIRSRRELPAALGERSEVAGTAA